MPKLSITCANSLCSVECTVALVSDAQTACKVSVTPKAVATDTPVDLKIRKLINTPPVA